MDPVSSFLAGKKLVFFRNGTSDWIKWKVINYYPGYHEVYRFPHNYCSIYLHPGIKVLHSNQLSYLQEGNHCLVDSTYLKYL